MGLVLSVCGNDCDPRGKLKGFMSVTGIPLRSSAFKLQTLNPDQCLYRLNDEEGHAHFKKGVVFIKKYFYHQIVLHYVSIMFIY